LIVLAKSRTRPLLSMSRRMPMTRYHIISAPLCSPLRFIINRAVIIIKKCRWYDGDAGVVRGDDPDVAPSTLRRQFPKRIGDVELCYARSIQSFETGGMITYEADHAPD
jgi:hypothetical protein